MPHPVLDLVRLLAPAFLIIPIAVRGAERRLLRRLRGERAVTEAAAIRLRPGGWLAGWQLGRLRRAGVVRMRGGEGDARTGPLMWLDETALTRWQQARRRRAALMAVIAAGAVLLLFLARDGGSHHLAVRAPDAARLPERDARVLVPDGMPLRVEDGVFIEDGAHFSFTVRNPSRDAAILRARVMVFDERNGLKGSVVYCPTDVVQPGTRQRVTFVLDVRTVTARDRFVIVLEEAAAARSVWRTAGSLGERLRLARRALDGTAPSLRVVVEPGSGALPACGCACGAAEAMGIEGCGVAGLAAYTCTPVFPGGCSQGFTCKR